jgi:hypothetical protein
MKQFISYILPAIITIVSNVIFYLLIKRRIDSSIERYKIAYSGVFKEKIDIYKDLLIEMHDLTLKLNQLQYFDSKDFTDEIKQSFNRLIKLYLTNRPFLSNEIILMFKQITKDLQSIYESLTLGNLSRLGKVPIEQVQKYEKAYWDAVNTLRSNKSLKEIEENIIKEMRKELQTN